MRTLILVLTLAALRNISTAQTFAIVETSTFVPENKKIALLKNAAGKKLIFFKTNLAVNTDGIPISYHPYDLRGDSIALNSILNAVSVYRLRDGVNLSVPRPKGRYSKAERSKMATEAYSAIEAWRESGYQPLSIKGYRIVWKNVLVPVDNKPCVFAEGKYKGYFASTTALTNGLTQDKGECNCNNQVDPFEIPALVLAANGISAKNPVRTFGATVGDLLLAYNPSNKALVYAIIGDTGPADNLGEGSVILNMKLNAINKFPSKKRDTYDLATGNNIMICIIPGSNAFELVRPYTQANIQSRITDWFINQGFTTEAEIFQFFETNRLQFK